MNQRSNVSKIKTSSFSIPILKYNKKFSGMKRSEINKHLEKVMFCFGPMIRLIFFFLQIQGSGLGVFENGEKSKFFTMEITILNTLPLEM